MRSQPWPEIGVTSRPATSTAAAETELALDETPPLGAAFSAGIRQIHLRLGDQIGLAIVRGDFKPGEAIPSEARLCEMFGVSRTAMREALRGLIAKGLVDSRPKTGTRVREPEHWNHLDADVLRWRLQVTDTDTYLRKMFQLRHATEPAAAALAAQAADPSDYYRLNSAFDAMVAAGADNSLWVEADLRFHKAIYTATHNEFFWPIGQLFSIALKEMFRIAALGSHRPRAIAEHQDLLRAILDGKPDLARAAALTLLGNASTDIVTIRSGAGTGVNSIGSAGPSLAPELASGSPGQTNT